MLLQTETVYIKKLSENFTRCLLELDSIDVKNQTRVRF